MLGSNQIDKKVAIEKLEAKFEEKQKQYNEMEEKWKQKVVIEQEVQDYKERLRNFSIM